MAARNVCPPGTQGWCKQDSKFSIDCFTAPDKLTVSTHGALLDRDGFANGQHFQLSLVVIGCRLDTALPHLLLSMFFLALQLSR